MKGTIMETKDTKMEVVLTKMEEVVLTKMVAKTKHSFYRLYTLNTILMFI